MNLDVSNANGLEDSLLNAAGQEYYSNAISPEQAKQAADIAKQGAQVISGLIQNKKANQSEIEKQVKAACGRKPLFGKAKKAKYQKCASDIAKSYQKANAPASTPAPTAPSTERTSAPAPAPEKNKFLGMPIGVAIGLGVAVLGLGGFLIYKKIKK